ncbi:ABC transporter permease subunit [Clostridium aminobutyricum]|uniref:ABC transporter permease subunit n=1 Tax=Clostridium aminobutyricum TaxID=33953 RepID=A0A939IGJ7_CLOAM|nr:ABC transporter permease subunit [Clostridium aminobutyricum]
MKLFIANMQNELKKLSTRKKFLVFLIIEVVICIICGVINMAIGKASGGVVSSSLILANMPMAMLSFFIQIYIPLIIFMAACDLFSGEVHDGTIRATFMRPVSRGKQYFSKIAAIMILAAIYIVTLFIFTTIIKGVAAHSTEGLIDSFLSYTLDIIPLIVLVLFAAMMNQFSRSPSLSIIICIIIYIALYIIGIIVPLLSGLLFTGYLQWHNLWIGATLPFKFMISKMGILVGYGMIFGCVGYYLFERREV